jgi:periplasmic protein TonB
MKRKNEMVPDFDEIIFENRNKTYGAYSLRKYYKSAASLSILGGIAFSVLFITILALTTKKSIAEAGPIVVVIAKLDPLIPKVIPPAIPKAPSIINNNLKNLKPEVTNDSTQVTAYIPTPDDLGKIENKPPDDSIPFIENTDPVVPVENKPFVKVEEMPEFPGGIPALMKFVGDNLNYPQEAQRNNIQGKVFLQFVVNADGSSDRIEVTRGVDPILDNEAVRVIKMLPKFKPGKQGGVPVPVWFTLPVTFKLENN